MKFTPKTHGALNLLNIDLDDKLAASLGMQYHDGWVGAFTRKQAPDARFGE